LGNVTRKTISVACVREIATMTMIAKAVSFVRKEVLSKQWLDAAAKAGALISSEGMCVSCPPDLLHHSPQHPLQLAMIPKSKTLENVQEVFCVVFVKEIATETLIAKAISFVRKGGISKQ
jgi:hypothetical protein